MLINAPFIKQGVCMGGDKVMEYLADKACLISFNVQLNVKVALHTLLLSGQLRICACSWVDLPD